MRISPMLFIALLTIASPLLAGDDGTGRQDERELDVLLTQRAAPIQSVQDLEKHLAENPNSPLLRLSDAGRTVFLDSLVFTEKGLASFNYKPLENELTPSQIHELLSLFGLARLTPRFENARIETSTDMKLLNATSDVSVQCPTIEGAQCVPPASCRKMTDWWCVTCNCGMITP